MEPTVLFWGLALLAALPALVVGLWIRQRRRWLEITLTGFVISGQDRRVYNDDQVIGLRQETATAADKSQKRRVVLEIAANEGVETIDCRYSVAANTVDPAAAFFERLTTGIAKRLDEGLAAGAALHGNGWRLDASGLHLGGKRLALENVGWVGFFDGHLCIWSALDDGEQPALRLPLGKRNVPVLGHVLWRRVQHKAAPGPAMPPSPLGRVLLERFSWGFSLGLGLFALAGSAMLLFLFFALLPWVRREPFGRREPSIFWVCVVVSACFTGIGAIIALTGRFGRLRFHERGVVQLAMWRRDRQLLYQDIGEVTWKGAELLILKPKQAGRAIHFRTVSGQLDPELAGMRDLASQPLAQEWSERIPSGPIMWTPKLRFLPGGLEYRPTGLLVAPDPVCVPYHLTSYRIEGNTFLLFVNEEKWPVCKQKLDAPNFFVGLVLLNLIYRQARAAAFPLPDAAAPLAQPDTPRDERIVGRMDDD